MLAVVVAVAVAVAVVELTELIESWVENLDYAAEQYLLQIH